jgi:hypothetical protein
MVIMLQEIQQIILIIIMLGKLNLNQFINIHKDEKFKDKKKSQP